MKKSMLVIMLMLIFMNMVSVSYASDWDKAGKVLAAIEGTRILTGGSVDVIGTITGINKTGYSLYKHHAPRREPEYKRYSRAPREVWVGPQVVWKKEYVPEHREYDPEYGKVIVEAHYIRYRVEEPGYWTCR